MSRDLLKYAGIAVVILLVFIGVVLFLNRGAHVVLDGSIQKVRVQSMDESSAVAIVDFRFVNSADYPFVLRTVTVFLEDSQGTRHEGMTVAEVDADRVFQYYPLLGPKYNPVFKLRDRVQPHETMDRMVCARFEMPESAVQDRRRLIIRAEDVDGAVSEIDEEPAR